MTEGAAVEREERPLGRWAWLYAAWLISLVGMLQSLFFSEVMGLPPCVLCWYQRICLYPLVAVLAVGIWFRDERVTRYGWPLVLAGLVLAGYHNLIYYHVIPESLSPCTQGVSCSTRQLEWLGFVTIPMLSLVAFLILAACLYLFSFGKEKEVT